MLEPLRLCLAGEGAQVHGAIELAQPLAGVGSAQGGQNHSASPCCKHRPRRTAPGGAAGLWVSLHARGGW